MKKIIVIDLEFCQIPKSMKSCFSNLNHEIIEIGAVMLDENMDIVGQFQEYIKPQYGVLSKRISQLTGITDEMLSASTYFPEALNHFLEWIGNDMKDMEMCSWSMTDYHQLKEEIGEKKLDSKLTDMLWDKWRDTQREFSDGLGYTGIVSLSTAMSAIDSDFSGKAHDALADAENTAKLVELMSDEVMFEKKTGVIASLFKAKENSGDTLGAMFANVFHNMAFA